MEQLDELASRIPAKPGRVDVASVFPSSEASETVPAVTSDVESVVDSEALEVLGVAIASLSTDIAEIGAREERIESEKEFVFKAITRFLSDCLVELDAGHFIEAYGKILAARGTVQSGTDFELWILHLDEKIREVEKKAQMHIRAIREAYPDSCAGRKFQLELKTFERLLADLEERRVRVRALGHDVKHYFGNISLVAERMSEKFDERAESNQKVVRAINDKMRANGRTRIEEVCEWVNAVLADFRLQAKQQNIEFHNSIQPGLSLHTLPGELSTVFNNLFSNALKFTPEGGVISISTEIELGERSYVWIKFSDTGIGMDRETLESVSTGKEVSSRKGVRGDIGTGVGLIGTKVFVEKDLGGIFQINSDGINCGTTVTIALPIRPEDLPSELRPQVS